MNRHLAPRVTVLLPVRNGAATLGEAIASVRAQTFASWELLVIDDGSTDDSAGVARCQAEADESGRIVVIRLPAVGLVAALEAGRARARGELIARMDADDWCHPRRLERQVAYLDAHAGVGVVGCRVAFGGDADDRRGYAAHVAWLNTLVSSEDHRRARFVESPLAHPSVVFRREVAEHHGGYRDGPFPEDYELWLRWFDAGVGFAKVDEELLVWNDSLGRHSRTDPRYSPEAFYRLKGGWLARHLTREVEPGRAVWLWGAGRVTRRRFRVVEEAGAPFAGFVDIDVRKTGRLLGGRRVVAPRELPAEAFVVVGVGNRGAREEIAACLRAGGREEGRDFVLAA
jgi:glycosyltransferase involved in cell wall biosynthesis